MLYVDGWKKAFNAENTLKTHLCAEVEDHAELKRSLVVGPYVDAVHSGVRGRYREQLAHHLPSTLNRHRARLLGRHARPVKRGIHHVLRKKSEAKVGVAPKKRYRNVAGKAGRGGGSNNACSVHGLAVGETKQARVLAAGFSLPLGIKMEQKCRQK